MKFVWQALSKLSSHALKLKQELQNVLQNIPMSSASLYQKSGVKVCLISRVNWPFVFMHVLCIFNFFL